MLRSGKQMRPVATMNLSVRAVEEACVSLTVINKFHDQMMKDINCLLKQNNIMLITK